MTCPTTPSLSYRTPVSSRWKITSATWHRRGPEGQLVFTCSTTGTRQSFWTALYNFTYLSRGILIYTVGSNTRGVDLNAVYSIRRRKTGTQSPLQKCDLTTAGQRARPENGTLACLPANPSGSDSRLVRVSRTPVEVLPAEPSVSTRVCLDGFIAAHHKEIRRRGLQVWNGHHVCRSTW